MMLPDMLKIFRCHAPLILYAVYLRCRYAIRRFSLITPLLRRHAAMLAAMLMLYYAVFSRHAAEIFRYAMLVSFMLVTPLCHAASALRFDASLQDDAAR